MNGAASSLNDLSDEGLLAALRATAEEIRQAQWGRLRPLGLRLNGLADEITRRSSGVCFAGDILARLERHATERDAVMRLALSDCLHPWATLVRAATTARVMLEANGRAGHTTPLGERLDAGLLALVYTVVVAVWFCDRSRNLGLTRIAANLLLHLIGLK